MAFGLFKVLKGLLIREENSLTPKEIEITPGGTSGTKTTIVSSQTVNRTITLPDATTSLTSTDSAQTLTNKTINADNNTITNIDNNEIKAAAAIDTTKLADGSVSNTEFQFIDGLTSNAQTQLNAKASLTGTETLQNKTLDNTNTITVKDTLLTVQDNADTSKQLRLELSGITTATTRTLTVPDANTTIVGTDATQSLSNKTLDNSNTITVKDTLFTVQDDADATKQMKFQASGITTGTTRILTIPDASTTLVGTDAVQTLSNKSFSDAVVLAEIATPSTPSSGNGKIYFKSDGFLYQLNDDGSESKVGAGSGGINYILNPDAESNTNGWVTYQDAAASRPVNGVGGSPTVTFTRSTSSPLRNNANFLFTKDAANRQGEGVSYDFTIARADQAKVMQISFDYEIGSGVYSGGTSSTDSDLIAYIYDVTNSQLIEPSGFKLDGAVVGTQYQFRGNFQTNSNSTSYRLILHVATTSASAYTVKIDNVIVGPQLSALSGSITTARQSYTPALTSSGGGAVTLNGTGMVNSGHWFRDGSDMVVEVVIRNGTGGAASGSAGILKIGIPTGYSADLTMLTSDTVLGSEVGDNSTTFPSVIDNTGVFFVFSATELSVAKLGSSGITVADIVAGYTFNITARFPIVGWGATQTLSSDTDTRVVAFKALKTASQIIAGDNIITFSSGDVVQDTHGGFNDAGDKYTIPISGYYKISAFSLVPSGAGGFTIGYKIDGTTSVSLSDGFQSAVGAQTWGGADTVYLTSGQYVQMRINSGGSFGAFKFIVERLSGPSQIAASETIALNAYQAAAQNINDVTATTIKYDTPTFDTHGMLNATTGVVTVPAPGIYEIDAIAYIAQNSSGRRQFSLKVDGSDYMIFDNAVGASAAISSQPVRGQTQVKLRAGQTLEVYIFQNSGSTLAVSVGQSTSALNVKRIGS